MHCMYRMMGGFKPVERYELQVEITFLSLFLGRTAFSAPQPPLSISHVYLCMGESEICQCVCDVGWCRTLNVYSSHVQCKNSFLAFWLCIHNLCYQNFNLCGILHYDAWPPLPCRCIGGWWSDTLVPHTPVGN